MKVKGKLPFLNIVLIMMIGLVACGQSNEETIEAADVEVDDITTYEQVTIELENRTVEFTEMPQRVVTLEQSATEMMLALGLEQYMVGTAFLSSEILPEYKDEYSNIPVIADKYPSKESFLEAN